MRRVIILLIVVLGICCKDDKRSTMKSEQKFVIPQLFNNKYINKELNEWMTRVSTDYDSLAGEELCYTVEFFTDSLYDRPINMDSVIVFSYYTPLDSYPGFKGVYNIGVKSVAIIDKKSIGIKYYNSKLLEIQPLDSFRGGPTVARRRTGALFELKHGKLTRLYRLDHVYRY